jgi:PKD repeat protein
MWETPISNLRSINAAFTASTNTPCLGDSVSFSDLSTGNPTSWLWTFTGGSPSTSNLQNPKVVFNTSGVFTVSLTVSGLGGNNTITKNNYISTTGQPIPLIQDFELTTFPPNLWSNVDGGSDGNMWSRSGQASGFGVGSGSMVFLNYSLNSFGARDQVVSPQYFLNGYGNYQLKFDVAHQLYSTSPTYLDSLAVLASTNCGVNYSSIYVKPGNTLATVPGTGGNFIPTSTQWRTDSVDLSVYSGQSIQLSFMNHGNYGNNIYVDNIRITGLNATVSLSLKIFMEGYYNPASNQMQAVSNPVGATTVTDTIMVSLASTTSPYNIIYTDQEVVLTNGIANLQFPIAAYNNSFYVVVKYRNAIETWSKTPILFNTTSKSFDLTTP